MHEDLSLLLPPNVYHALDSSSGMEGLKHAKLQKTCKKYNMSKLLDATTSAAFGHQTSLISEHVCNYVRLCQKWGPNV
jgi:hypothetical protein